MTAIIYVCETCRPAGHDDADARPGAVLSKALHAARVEGVTVQGVQCLSVCKRPCAVTVTGEGKFAYTIADADPNLHVDDLIRFAAGHAASTDGIVPWRERPEVVKRSVVSRTPAPGQQSSLISDIEDV